MGFGGPAAVGAKIACPDRVVVSLVGDGGFGQNPAVLATAREQKLPVVWVVMNNNAFGTIAGLEKAAFDTTYGTVFGTPDDPLYTDFAAIATAYGVTGIKVESAAEFKPALERAIAANGPVVIDVSMVNVPTPTTGHWNILDIYSPDEAIEHVATE
jgi:acetolactate synthase-1/2/3 large subunit